MQNVNRRSHRGFQRRKSIACAHSMFTSNISMRLSKRSVWTKTQSSGGKTDKARALPDGVEKQLGDARGIIELNRSGLKSRSAFFVCGTVGTECDAHSV